MKDETAYTILTRRGESGETSVGLKMTEAEFWQLVNQYKAGKVTEKNYIGYQERLEEAREAVGPGEALKQENFNGVDTECFEKMVVILKFWTEMIFNEMKKQKNFRIEIRYNAEALKTDFCIYTPIEHGQDGTPPEPDLHLCEDEEAVHQLSQMRVP